MASFPKPSNRLSTLTLAVSCASALLGHSALVLAQQDTEPVAEVTISAIRLPRAIDNVAGTVSLLTAAQLEQEMANDLDDIARFLPGVSLNSSPRGGNQGFSIRGMGGNRVLTVIDGVRGSDIYSAGPSSYGKDNFEVDNLKSVEIIRGPASVLYGADALGGAVILTTKDARDYVGASQGSYFNLRMMGADASDQFKLGGTSAFQNNDLGTILQVTRRDFAEREVNGPGSLNPQDGHSDSLLLQSTWEFAEHQQLQLSFESFAEDNAVILESDLSESVTSSLGNDETERQRFGLAYKVAADTLLLDSLQLLLNWQDTDALQRTEQERRSFSFIDPRDRATYGGTQARRVTDFGFNQQTSAVNLNLRKTLEGRRLTHSLAYGFNFDETDTERPRNRCETALSSGRQTCGIAAYPFAPREDFPNRTFPDTTTTRWGVYLQDEIVIAGSRLTLIPGLRYDRYAMQPDANSAIDGTGDIAEFGGFSVSAVDEGQASLSLGALFDLNATYSLFGQYAEGYRPPNFDEANQAFVNLGLGYASIPNPELGAESSRGLEFGLRADYARGTVSLALFNNRYEDFIQGTFVGTERDISLFQDRNIGEAEIRGAELLANFSLAERVRVRGSLAYARGDDLVTDSPLDSVDPLTAVLGLAYDSRNGAWGGEVLLTAVGEKDRVSSPELVTADGYAVVDLIGHYDLADSSTLRFGLFNLFDQEYARWANIQGLDADAINNIQNSQEPGINFRLGFDIEFQ